MTIENFTNNHILLSPTIGPEIQKQSQAITSHFPKIDITSTTHKISLLPKDSLKKKHSFDLFDLMKSLLFHLTILVIPFVSSIFLQNTTSQENIVEVSFGLSEKLQNTYSRVNPKTPDALTEATKTKNQLPQLRENDVPKENEKSFHQTFQDKTISSKDLVYSDKLNKRVQHTSEKLNNANAQKRKNDEQEKKSNLNKMDYLKRKELDLRSIAEIKKDGVHQKVTGNKLGQKHSPDSIPKSPFQIAESIPDAPTALAPTGSENGKTNSTEYNLYKIYLRNQLKLNWNVEIGNNFAPGLFTTVQFTVNPFGYLIADVKVLKSSGNSSFDNLVIAAVKSTFPVEQPPPQSIHPPQTFQAKYSVQSIN